MNFTRMTKAQLIEHISGLEVKLQLKDREISDLKLAVHKANKRIEALEGSKRASEQTINNDTRKPGIMSPEEYQTARAHAFELQKWFKARFPQCQNPWVNGTKCMYKNEHGGWEEVSKLKEYYDRQDAIANQKLADAAFEGMSEHY